MATLKIYQNGAWVPVGTTSGSGAPVENLSSIDIREVTVSGAGTITVDTNIEYSEALQVLMLSHDAPIVAHLTLASATASELGTLLTFTANEAVNTTVLLMAVTSAAASISDALEASREALAAVQTIRPYVDRIEQTAASIGVYHWNTISIPASAWSNRLASIEVDGILATDYPHIAPLLDEDDTTAAQQKANWGYIGKATSYNGYIEFECYGSTPSIDLPIQIEVLRGGRAEFVEEVEY